MAAINNDWLEALREEFGKPYYKQLFETVNQEYKTRLVFPPADDIFNAFHLTPLHKVKVVILGQDPYHLFILISTSCCGHNSIFIINIGQHFNYSHSQYLHIQEK